MDYVLKFELCAETLDFSAVTFQLIEIAERTRSSVGGGSDNRTGEFYIDAAPRFGQADLIEMIAVLLPNTTSLTINSVKPKNSMRQRNGRVVQVKHTNGKTQSSRRTSASRTAKVHEKV